MGVVLTPRMIRRKMRAVGNLKKITRAMEMVSAAKLRKVQDKLLALRPYAEKIDELMVRLVPAVEELEHPFIRRAAAGEQEGFREKPKRKALVVVASDKGLCGSYNSNLLRAADRFLAEQTEPVQLIAIGTKARAHLRREHREPEHEFTQLPTLPDFFLIRNITRTFLEPLERGELESVWIAYTEFVNALTFRVRVSHFLPVEPQTRPAEEGKTSSAAAPIEYIFEPKPARILEALIPRYVEMSFYRTLLDAFASEHGTRMNAMRNATKNAEDMIDELTLRFNKARQASITKELLDIVGGAEALKG